MRKQVVRRWILFRKDHTGRRPHWFSLDWNREEIVHGQLVHFYKQDAEDRRETFADPDMWGLERVKISLEPIK